VVLEPPVEEDTIAVLEQFVEEQEDLTVQPVDLKEDLVVVEVVLGILAVLDTESMVVAVVVEEEVDHIVLGILAVVVDQEEEDQVDHSLAHHNLQDQDQDHKIHIQDTDLDSIVQEDTAGSEEAVVQEQVQEEEVEASFQTDWEAVEFVQD